MKHVFALIKANKPYFFLLAGFIYLGLMCWLNSMDVAQDCKDGFSWHDLLVEANGMVADLFVFGVLLAFYESWKDTGEKIERLQEEIDDYKGWKEPEAVYRTVGAIKRLIKINKDRSKIDLQHCFLEGAILNELDLHELNLAGAFLNGAKLQQTDLKRAFLLGAELKGALLHGADLQGADLQYANLRGALLDKALILNHIPGSTAEKPWTTEYKKTNLKGVSLEWAKVDSANWIDLLKKWDVIGHEEISTKYIIDENLELRLKVN